MDAFEHAALRLAKDQSRIRRNRPTNRINNGKTSGGIPRTTNGITSLSSSSSGKPTPSLSENARREAEKQKQHQEQLAHAKARTKRLLQCQKQYFQEWEERMGVQELVSEYGTHNNKSLQLTATSIHGDGDKIALPPSILEFLTTQVTELTASSPWYFRIGIVNPEYKFPSSPVLQSYDFKNDDDDDDPMKDDDEDEESVNGNHDISAYIDELNHKYISYTHCTVVEFTQEEGYIGLPRTISDALLRSNNNSKDSKVLVPTTRTIDPAAVNRVPIAEEETKMQTNEIESIQDGSPTHKLQSAITEEESGTPGHVAYNAFDIPNVPIEICIIRNLPKGKTCRLVPSIDAIKNGFYNLQNIKLVLEQSLIRTRATLSIYDTIYTWHRGTKYALFVDSVNNSSCNNTSLPVVRKEQQYNYPAVSCINTDIEIEFGTNTDYEKAAHAEEAVKVATTKATSGGYKLGVGGNAILAPTIETTTTTDVGVSNNGTDTTSTSTQNINGTGVPLIPEPSLEHTETVVKIQIRGPNGISGQRRFDVTVATVLDLYQFASALVSQRQKIQQKNQKFQLVTRFPRRVILLTEASTASQTFLSEIGINPGQELLMIEYQE